MSERINVGVIGAGAWGTALATLVAKKVDLVEIWAYEEETVQQINQQQINLSFLPQIRLPANLSATHNMQQVIENHLILIMAFPSHVTRSTLRTIRPFLTKEHTLVIASKGIENDTLALMSEVYQQELDPLPTVSILSGPTFAQEVARGLPTGAVLACSDRNTQQELQEIFHTKEFRVYPSSDLIGVQIGGTMKNVIAIASGIADGMELGLNARSAMICRGLAEMTRLGVYLGGQAETFRGMSGLGDLVLTATGHLSRNYSLGIALGKGQTLAEYQKDKHSVAEGIKSTKSVYQLSEKYQIDLPISRAVYQVLYDGFDVKEALDQLLNRELPPQE